MIQGVLFDLDDTLFDQRRWLAGAWEAVAHAAAHEVDAQVLFDALLAIAGEGSAKGRIIDRALARVGAPASLVPELVQVFRAFRAVDVEPYPGVREALSEVRRTVPTGLVTDGDPEVQRAKVQVLGLADLFDVVVCSDELGRDRRKPHPAPFALALEALDLTVAHAVHVGDHPVKDVAGAVRMGMRVVRVLTGEYAAWPSDPAPWFTAGTAVEACARLFPKNLVCPI